MGFVLYCPNMDRKKLLKENIAIEAGCEIAKGVKLWQNVFIGKNSKIGEGCEITSNSILQNVTIGTNVVIKSSYLEDSQIGDNTMLGPYAHTRNNAKIGERCVVGNFVEIKSSTIGDGSKIAHLAYVGDAEVGKNCNIGCGVIFCNYDGCVKQKTVLGDDVFVGSNTNLIAPLLVGSGAYIGAGSTITQNILPKNFAIARARQEVKSDFKNPYTDKKKM